MDQQGIEQGRPVAEAVPDPVSDSSDQTGLDSSIAHTDEDNPCGYADRETMFGLLKKKIYYPKSDFGLELKEYVSAGSLTGYFCDVTRQMDRKTRFVYTS